MPIPLEQKVVKCCRIAWSMPWSCFITYSSMTALRSIAAMSEIARALALITSFMEATDVTVTKISTRDRDGSLWAISSGTRGWVTAKSVDICYATASQSFAAILHARVARTSGFVWTFAWMTAIAGSSVGFLSRGPSPR